MERNRQNHYHPIIAGENTMIHIKGLIERIWFLQTDAIANGVVDFNHYTRGLVTVCHQDPAGTDFCAMAYQKDGLGGALQVFQLETIVLSTQEEERKQLRAIPEKKKGEVEGLLLNSYVFFIFFSPLSVKPSYELSFGQSQSTQDGVSVAWQLIEPDRKSPSQKLQLSHIKGSIESNRIQSMAMTEQSQETSPILQAEVGMHAETPLQYCYTHGPPLVYSRLI